jgi:hypothetical protein
MDRVGIKGVRDVVDAAPKLASTSGAGLVTPSGLGAGQVLGAGA